MFRWRRASRERIDPGIAILLSYPAAFPGDLMTGVVVLDLPAPEDVLTLEVRLCGTERATLGGLFITDKNPEARSTVYFEQYITVRGADHDLLNTKRSLIERCRSAVSPKASSKKLSSYSMEPLAQESESGVDPSSPGFSNTSGAALTSTLSLTQSVVEKTVHLTPGVYVYPFSTVLPDLLPPSRDLSRARDGRCVLRYVATASLFLVSGKVFKTETQFRIYPLPVQVQRWFRLHSALRGLDETSENDVETVVGEDGDGDATESASRVGMMSRLMSNLGTSRVSEGDQAVGTAHQNRIQHASRFPDSQIMLEEALYTKTTASRMEKKKRRVMKRAAALSNVSRSATSDVTSMDVRKTAKQAHRRHQWLADGETHSLDAASPTAGRVTRHITNEEDDVYVFGPNDPSMRESANTTEAGEEDKIGNETGQDQSGAKLGGEQRKDEGAKTKQSLHPIMVHTASARVSSMVEVNVERLRLTPQEQEIHPPSPRSSGQKTATSDSGESDSSSSADGVSDKKEENKTVSSSRLQSVRFRAPKWRREFVISLRGGFLHSGKVRVQLTLRSPLVTVGSGKARVKSIIDNTNGCGTVSRVKFLLITRCCIRSKTESYCFDVENSETNIEVGIEKGKVHTLEEVELPVPKSTPLTLLTEGMSTRTFVNVRLYVATALKTFSRSLETEVVLVSGQDLLNCSRRLLRWTCYFRRRREGAEGETLPIRPPTVNLSEKNSALLAVNADGGGGTASMHGVSDTPLGEGGDEAASRPSVVESLRILCATQRLGKKAPDIDIESLASALNYTQAVFMPPGVEEDAPGATTHIDPMNPANPFLSPSIVNGG